MRLPIELPTSDGLLATFSADHADALFAAIDDDRVWEHLPGPRPQSPAELRERLDGGTNRHTLVISDGAVVGTSSYILDPDDALGVEIGATMYAPRVWGLGLNARAKGLMLAAAFDAGARWVQLRTDERNGRSAAAILKLPGAVEREPRLEPHIVRRDGTTRTSRVFRIPRPD
ncbi:GNAT family protein [Tsukamurella sp. 8F]|uniref:GNAT family N-acetyltransferase n=1 Tax=unclassified Tsukamurella TaxID=2633480 RepID=UPI0023B9AA20|nr:MULTISPECIES: GNAT family protein [unclassified Tsukamurella]MDF0528946.1 GNAT family protein [Tsukamurella sp. 8J]MDF0589150.1 GNAT family protein [Tsukamurella sp. 8F]